MAQIKNIKKPGDLIRGAKVGVAGLDKDGNVVGTGKSAENLLPNFGSGTKGKWLQSDPTTGAPKWNDLPGGLYSVVAAEISIKDASDNEIPHGVNGRLINFGGGMYYICARINFHDPLESITSVKIKITGVPANNYGSYHYNAYTWSNTPMILAQTINSDVFDMTIPASTQYLMINTMIFALT